MVNSIPTYTRIYSNANKPRLTRYIGCYTAYGVFFWRYWNVPQNWEYVGSFTSVATIIVTLIPETIYPFLYLQIHNANAKKNKAE